MHHLSTLILFFQLELSFLCFQIFNDAMWSIPPDLKKQIHTPLVLGSIKLFDASLERYVVFPLGEMSPGIPGLDVLFDRLWPAFANTANEKVLEVYKVTYLAYIIMK